MAITIDQAKQNVGKRVWWVNHWTKRHWRIEHGTIAAERFWGKQEGYAWRMCAWVRCAYGCAPIPLEILYLNEYDALTELIARWEKHVAITSLLLMEAKNRAARFRLKR